MNPDGNFSTVKSTNPEDVESLNLAIKLANKEDAKMVIGTDPDADRLGVAVRDYNNKIILLNGNQLMILVFNYLLEQKSNNQKLNKKNFIASTIVSTPMVEKIAEYYNIDCKLSLTGFKWIAKMIDENPNQKFIAGGEESYGLMIGDYIRDKDSIAIANKAKVKITVVSHPISIIGTKRANKKVLNPITSANDVVIMALPDSVIALFIECSTELPRDLANLYLLTT